MIVPAAIGESRPGVRVKVIPQLHDLCASVTHQEIAGPGHTPADTAGIRHIDVSPADRFAVAMQFEGKPHR